MLNELHALKNKTRGNSIQMLLIIMQQVWTICSTILVDTIQTINCCNLFLQIEILFNHISIMGHHNGINQLPFRCLSCVHRNTQRMNAHTRLRSERDCDFGKRKHAVICVINLNFLSNLFDFDFDAVMSDRCKICLS